MRVRDALCRLFGLESVSAFYTRCVLLEAGGGDKLVEGLERVRCRHEGEVGALECLGLAVNGQTGWATACLVDGEVEGKAVQSACPQTMCIALHKQVLVPLAPPPAPVMKSVPKPRTDIDTSTKMKKTKKKKKEPNPLSCKKKAKVSLVKTVSSMDHKKKTRRSVKKSAAKV